MPSHRNQSGIRHTLHTQAPARLAQPHAVWRTDASQALVVTSQRPPRQLCSRKAVGAYTALQAYTVTSMQCQGMVSQPRDSGR
jgi:hypothetical protein